MAEMTSSEQVHLEESGTLCDTETTLRRQNTLNKIGKSFSIHMEDDENENLFVKISEACKCEAAKQSSSLLEVAEGLCNRQSPGSQRRGKIFKKLAPEVEKQVFNEMQQDLCKNMWQEARLRVFGTPSSEAGGDTAAISSSTDTDQGV